MKQLIILLTSILIISLAADAQATNDFLTKNKDFTGAVADKKVYNAIFQLDNNDPKIINKAISNINNVLNDERLKNKINIELIAFSGGTDAYFKGSKYENDIKALAEKGVIVAQCNNTLRIRNISRDSLYNFIGIVPSGTGELIIRQAQGWSVIKP